MRYCFSLILACLLTVAGFCGNLSCNMAEAADSGWYWISSNNNYTKFYAPNEVKVQEAFNGTATRITALTKTIYSYGGALETLTNYGITNIKPNDLAYSIANIQIIPQTRNLSYLDEVFYDKNGNKLWSKTYQPVKYKEMNSQEFDEDFYAFIVDSVFGLGEVERRSAADRWLVLWQATQQNGVTVNCIADTTTMRMSGDNIIFWAWQEYKNANGSVVEIRFLKKAVNIPQYTGKIVRYKHWNSKEGWRDYTEKETDGLYHAVNKGSVEEKELEKLALYEISHRAWVHRYSL